MSKKNQRISDDVMKTRIYADTFVTVAVPTVLMTGLVLMVFFAAGKTTVLDMRLDVAVSLAVGIGGGAYGWRERKLRKQMEASRD